MKSQEMYKYSPKFKKRAVETLFRKGRKRKLKGNFESYKENAQAIEFPNPAEGIDEIYEVVDGKVHMRMDPPTPDILESAREELAKEAEKIRIEDEAEKKR